MRIVILISCVVLIVLISIAQPTTTSDISKSPSARLPDPIIIPGRAPVFVEPHISVCIKWLTNVEPIVVREKIYSNACLMVISHEAGQWHTNHLLLTNRLVNVTTNYLP